MIMSTAKSSSSTTSQDSSPFTSKKRPHSSVSQKKSSVVFLDPACQNYAGYVPCSTSQKQKTVDRVDATTIAPHEFFARYVARRRPCLLTKVIPSPDDLPVIMDLPTLAQQAGSVSVQIERRPSSDATFGQDRTLTGQVVMTLAQLLALPRDELPQYYLSTQESTGGDEEEDGGSPNPTDSPLWRALASHLNPLAARVTDALVGRLIRDSRHLWLGFASSSLSSSSGLHHDFHDNFNLVVHGRKDWTIYPPTDYPNIPVYGTIQGLHGINGLISYRDHPTRADGVPLALVLAQHEKDDDEDDDEDVDEDAVLGFGADYVSEEDESGPEDPNENASDVPNGAHSNNQSLESQDGVVALESGEESEQRRPNSFSPVDLTLDATVLAQQFPEFDPRGRLDVTVQAGEALYLPASWFHCVTSYSHDAPNPNATGSASVGGSEADAAASPPYHLALNFWYHPPDQHVYEKPYRDNYWETKQTAKTRK